MLSKLRNALRVVNFANAFDTIKKSLDKHNETA